MTNPRTGQRVTFGPAEWLGVAAIILTILGAGWAFSSRITRLETTVEIQFKTLSDEVNRLRDAKEKTSANQPAGASLES